MEKMSNEKMKKSKEVKSGRRGEKTCKPKADSDKLKMQHKMQTFMNFMKLAEALESLAQERCHVDRKLLCTESFYSESSKYSPNSK